MFIVFDLDDTLANADHRLHYIKDAHGNMLEAPDWDGFFAARVDDTPIARAVALFHTLRREHHVVIWTAAREDSRTITERWLWERCGIPPLMLTRMRSYDDKRNAVDLKEEWIKNNTPDMAFDDHTGVVAMMRRHGVFACAAGNNDY